MDIEMQKVESRIEWVDIFKGIMIILMVVGHATGKFNSWIYQFHMAAFFFISGYLSSVEVKNDYSVAIKKFLNILLPFFSLGVIGILINEIINRCGLYEFLFGSEFVGIHIAIRELFLRGNVYVQYWGAFWFLIALFGVECFHLILCRINGKKLIYHILLYHMGCIF